MTLKELGFTGDLEKYILENRLTDFEIGRVVAEHKELYIVRTPREILEAEITGNLRYGANSREDFPATGDWVTLIIHEPGFAVIHRVLPRFSIIKRQHVSQPGEVQVIATNIDYGLIVQSVDRDLNLNRLERYLTICHSSKVTPIVLLTKTDLIEEQELYEIKKNIEARMPGVNVISVSNVTRAGYDTLKRIIKKGKTYCMLGSSGVGKSTLINHLSEREMMRTDTISQSTGKGRHITTHREIVVMPSGGILVDNPGIREVGVGKSAGGLDRTFELIVKFSQNCKFKDCTHTAEKGCAVLEAVTKGDIDQKSYDNYKRIEKETAHFEADAKEKSQKDKSLGKLRKNYKKLNIKQRKQ